MGYKYRLWISRKLSIIKTINSKDNLNCYFLYFLWILLISKHLYFYFYAPVTVTNDSDEYARQAHSINQSSDTRNYNFHPPGYSYFISLFSIFGQYSLHSILAVQHILYLCTIFYFIQTISFPNKFLLCALLIDIHAFTCNFILPEIIIISLLIIIYTQYKTKSRSNYLFFIFPLLSSFIVLVKPILVLIILPFLILFYKKKEFPVRFYPIGLIIFFLLPLLACIHNDVRWQNFSLSDRSNLHLYNRVIARDKLVFESGIHYKELNNYLSKEQIFSPHWEVRKNLEKYGFTFQEISDLLRRVSIEGILNNKILFCTNTLFNLFDDIFIDPMFYYIYSDSAIKSLSNFNKFFNINEVNSLVKRNSSYSSLSYVNLFSNLHTIILNNYTIFILFTFLFILTFRLNFHRGFTFLFAAVYCIHSSCEITDNRYIHYLYPLIPFLLSFLLFSLNCLIKKKFSVNWLWYQILSSFFPYYHFTDTINYAFQEDLYLQYLFRVTNIFLVPCIIVLRTKELSLLETDLALPIWIWIYSQMKLR